MSISRYLREQAGFIAFYLLVTSFSVGVIFLDRANLGLTPNARYMLLVLLVLGLIYLALDYIIKRNHCQELQQAAQGQKRDWLNNLPSAGGFEQELYHGLLQKLYQESNEGLDLLRLKGKEDLDFVTTWVHEIKTPIAVAQLLVQNNRGTPTDQVLDSLEEELGKIEGYVTRALFYSRSNDFAQDYLIKTYTLDKIVKECIKGQAKTFIQKNIRLTLEGLDLEVATDKKWLGFLLDQMIANSLKYTADGGEVDIRAEKNEQEIVLHIADSGVGIRAEDLARVFERGFTGYNGRQEAKSTGMGLYLSRRVAKKLGHYLTIASQPGIGTTVSIHFPKYSDYLDVTKM